jgi:hypothetical protein
MRGGRGRGHDVTGRLAPARRLAPGEDPALVEAWMRSEHGALENIEPRYLARAR